MGDQTTRRHVRGYSFYPVASHNTSDKIPDFFHGLHGRHSGLFLSHSSCLLLSIHVAFLCSSGMPRTLLCKTCYLLCLECASLRSCMTGIFESFCSLSKSQLTTKDFFRPLNLTCSFSTYCNVFVLHPSPRY